ncbi:unnamed protein product [Taenia asiatica]|uniref:Uncharacterized protein n=1 Tax=Taenia asiatica TaxID=60517 RepID=A0A0R3VV35_TAEAS|nr:unnamed protein product [Taenia asiatica]
MPNILQSLLQRNVLPPMVTPNDAKYSLIPPNHSHPHLPPPWNTMENSVFLGGSGGGVNYYARRRPHSLVVPSDSSTMLDLTRRLSCSVFCPIAVQEQAGLPPTKPLECQSFAAIPEDEVAISTTEENNNELHDDGKITSAAGIAS